MLLHVATAVSLMQLHTFIVMLELHMVYCTKMLNRLPVVAWQESNNFAYCKQTACSKARSPQSVISCLYLAL